MPIGLEFDKPDLYRAWVWLLCPFGY
jgi:hypothetical protein